MSKDIGIMISAKDRYSDVIKSMQAATQAFGKDTDGLNSKLTSLGRAYGPLEMEVKQLEKTMKAAQDDFERLGDAASKAMLETASADFAQGKRNLQMVSKEIRQTQKDMISLSTEGSKFSNKAGGIFGTLNELRGSLAGSQLMGMFGTAIAGLGSSRINSALGDTAGNAVNTILSSTASGAAMGMLLPVPGNVAIGAGIGAAAGGMQAATQYLQKEDDEFKSVRQSEYDRVKGMQQADLTAGIEIAAQREMDKVAFTNKLGGENEADEYLSWLRELSNNTPFLYGDLAEMSRTLSAYKYSPDEMKKIIVAIGDTGASVGAQNHDMQMMIKGLGRIRQTGKTNLEYLNPMLERGIDAWEYMRAGFSKEIGREISEREIQEMSSRNELDGGRAVEYIIAGMIKDDSGEMEKMSQTYSGLASTVKGLNQELQSAFGEGFIGEQSKGMRDQIDFFNKDGERLADANRLMGVYQADLVNQRDAKIREAELAAIEQFEKDKAAMYAEVNARTDINDDEKQAERDRLEKELGARAGSMMAEAHVNAEVAYRNTDAYALYEATEIDLIKKLGVALVDDYYLFGQNMKRASNRGMASISSLEALVPPSVYNNSSRIGGKVKTFMGEDVGAGDKPIGANPNGFSGRRENNLFAQGAGAAYGVASVPKDDTPYRLHEGERVLTAQEARAYNSGQSATNITININGPVVRDETDVEAVARAIAEQLTRAKELM